MSSTGLTAARLTVPSLTRWGISADADLVYRALLTSQASSSRQLAADLGFGMRRIRIAVDELAAASLLKPLANGGWLACAVEAALAILRRHRFPQVDPWTRARQHLAAVADLQLPEHPETMASGARRIEPALIRTRIRELALAERHEHLALQPEQVFSAEAVAAALPLDEQLVRRGVKLRMIGVPPADGDTSAAPSAALERVGGEYREAVQVATKMMIFDRKVLMIAAGLSDQDGAYEIADKSIVDAALVMFTRSWLQARDPGKKGVRPIMLTPRERAVVEALSKGLTDQQAAAQLKISTRTVGYALSALMDRLNVENRFQLGLVLGAASSTPIPNEEDDNTDEQTHP